MEQISEAVKLKSLEYQTELSDVHCHLDLFDDPYSTAKNAISKGIGLIITAGGSMESNTKASWISEEIDLVFAVVGIDPSFVKKEYENIGKIESLIKSKSKVIGIGEIGLDYKIDGADREQQKDAFVKQLDVAKDLDVPVVVHARNAIDDVIMVLEQEKVRRAVLHFFEGDVEQAKRLASKGYLISIPPAESSRRKRIIKALGISNIAVETDSPVVGRKTPLLLLTIT